MLTPLGAGQDVGRSCILISIGEKNIMFDCGMHMGYNDNRRFPDFNYISKQGRIDSIIDCVIISHFHLDHCGALPYFTEIVSYNGPIYMTYPTKAICPILLEDYRKITVDKKGETGFFSSEDIKNCMRKCTAVNIHQTIQVDSELQIRAYYAGHVLGAAMFFIKVGTQSVVYTGDYNMTPDRHLGAAWIEPVRPDILITETTYATTIRDSKRARERDFLKKVHDCVSQGGKVLIPVFALGRAQELCILIETYWERLNLDIPVYFSGGLTGKANAYYKLFITWTNQKIKSTFAQRNMFDFKYIKEFNPTLLDHPGPMVLFATPGMLHSGFSLEVFKLWAPDPKNMVILPGYCVAGTVGAKVLAGQKVIEVDRFTKIYVNMQVQNLSFSAHADAKGILQLIKMCQPKNVVLVHGEKGKMAILKNKIMKELGLPCFDPGNGCTLNIQTSRDIPIDFDTHLLQLSKTSPTPLDSRNSILNQCPFSGVLVMDDKICFPKLVPVQDATTLCDIKTTQFTFAMCITLNPKVICNNENLCKMSMEEVTNNILAKARVILNECFLPEGIIVGPEDSNHFITLKSLSITPKYSSRTEKYNQDNVSFNVNWSYEDEAVAIKTLALLKSFFQ